MYYSFSTDGAQTWSTPQRVTSELSPNINDGFEYGDYSGLDIVMNDLVAIFTDNRNESGGSGDSIDIYAAGITPGGGGGPGGAGRIPGSMGLAGLPLTVDKLPGTDLQLDWSAACTGNDYAVYEGIIGTADSKSPIQCSTGGATDLIVSPSSGSRFYIVVPQSDGDEGSYGKQSTGVERTPDTGACTSQLIASCP